MSEATFTQADLDAAIAKAVGPLKESVDKLETKNAEIVGENRRLKRAGEIKPEDLAAAEDRADKAEKALTDLTKQVSTLTKERDTAAKELEAEQGAARGFALDATIASAIAEGNVVPALVPAFKAMVAQQAKAELVDGKYVVTIGDKPASDHIKSYLDGEEGKAFRAAPINGGGGAPGSGGATGGDKNPFAKETFNLTEQGNLIKADPAKAKTLASAAGVTLPA